MAGGTRVTAVVVTWNRRDLLLESLAALMAQDRPADAVIVVDNASTDGAADAVRGGSPECTWPCCRATPAARAGSPTGWRWPCAARAARPT